MKEHFRGSCYKTLFIKSEYYIFFNQHIILSNEVKETEGNGQDGLDGNR